MIAQQHLISRLCCSCWNKIRWCSSESPCKFNSLTSCLRHFKAHAPDWQRLWLWWVLWLLSESHPGHCVLLINSNMLPLLCAHLLGLSLIYDSFTQHTALNLVSWSPNASLMAIAPCSVALPCISTRRLRSFWDGITNSPFGVAVKRSEVRSNQTAASRWFQQLFCDFGMKLRKWMRIFACAKRPFKESAVRLSCLKYFTLLMLLASYACDVSSTLAGVNSQSLACKDTTAPPLSKFAPSAGKLGSL